VAQQVFVVWLQTPFGQVPHVTVPPHPSLNDPHSNCAKSLHFLAAHGGPQTPFELHTWPVAQSPQWMVALVQLLVMSPHVRPRATHSSGVSWGSQWFAIPRTPQLWPLLQPNPDTLSQSTMPPHPFEMKPHWTPLAACAAAQMAAAVPGVQLGSQL
jgi:hypothetical protein